MSGAPLAVVAGGPRLPVDSSGSPVWPVRDDAELTALSSIAAVFGSRVRVQGAREAAGGHAPPPGAPVVALERACRDEARLYAHLTGREYRFCEDPRHLMRGGAPAVVVAGACQVTARLLDALYDPEAGDAPAPGLLFADTPRALRRQVLVRSAAAALGGAVHRRRVDVYPGLSLSRAELPGREIVGGEATADELSAALRGDGLVHVVTHADGIDAFLGARTLCPMGRAPAGADAERSPSCRANGHCHRHHMPVESARQAGLLLDPAEISARVLVLNGCSGVLAQPSFLDARWGLAPRLAESGSLGAVITSWKVIVVSPAMSEALARSIADGMPVGAALAAYNRSPEVRAVDSRLCLLGDPLVRLPPPLAPQPEPAPPRRERAAPAGSFLERYLGEGPAAAETRARALELARAPRAGGPALREAVLRVLAENGGSVFRETQRLAHDIRHVAEPRECPGCSQPLTVLEASFGEDGEARRVATCPRCFVIEDTPARTPAPRLAVEDGRVRITGWPAHEEWDALVLVEPASPERRTSFPWPADGAGRPAEACSLPQPLPGEPVYVTAVVMWGDQLTIARRPARGRASPPPAPAPARAAPSSEDP